MIAWKLPSDHRTHNVSQPFAGPLPDLEVIENGAGRGMHELKKCNSCGNTYPSNLSFCLNDGTPLTEIDSMIGMILDGRYRLDSLIGVGGMGDVYRATHIHIDNEFAVKLLKPEFVANQTAIKRFRLEARAAGRIQHPNAVRVTDFGVTPERVVYLVMELVTGQSLRNLIRREGKVDYLRTVNIVRQVCGAVDAAHRAGVIHRDLKPDNVLIEIVNNTERVKVLDFGIAKLKETQTDAFLTQAGTIIGTPQYMSPEQCQGKNLDPTSDIYSIGVILYEMLTGAVPFDGESTLQVVYDQLHLAPRPLLEHSPDVPPLLAQVVMRALEKDPSHRQPSALQLSDELRDAVEAGGEGNALSITNPLVIRPLASTVKTPSKGPLGIEDENGSLPAFAEAESSASDRETAVMSRSSDEDEIATLEAKRAKSTYPNRPAGLDQETRDTGLQTSSRIRLIAIAAAALIILVSAIIYFSGKDDQTANVTQPPTAPPNAPVTAPEGMAYLLGGKFIMGRDDGSSDEGPAHEVEVQPFFLDIQEVTNQEYKKFIDATGRPAPKHWKFNGSYVLDEARFPVTYVTWNDASAYAAWAEKRLPTEAEWEYAARGGNQGFRYPWGNQWQDGYANVDRKGQAKPAPVRSFEKDVSPFGIYDLAGNVSEWVQDFYSERYGAKPDQRFRVYRGGNFLDGPDKGTSTYRWSDFPTEIPDDQMLRVGFRCAKDVAK